MASPEGASTKGAHLRQVQKHKGVDLLPDATCPEELTHVWAWFLELTGSRTNTGFGMSSLTYAEIRAWSDLTGQRPTAWEVSLIKRLDRVYLSIMAKAND